MLFSLYLLAILGSIFFLIAMFYFIIVPLSSLINDLTRRNTAPYVPSRRQAIEMMIKMANLRTGETVYDLGCGDGRLVFEASKIKGTKCIGIEVNPCVFLLAWAKGKILGSSAIIKKEDLFTMDLSGADVIFTYLLPRMMWELEDKIISEGKKNVRIIANSFEFKKLKCLKEERNGKVVVREYSIA